MRIGKLQLMAGLAAGAGVMYLLDPDRGRRRRAFIRDQAAKARRKLVERGTGRAKDIANRGKGVIARLRHDSDERAGYADETSMSRADTADEARSAAEEVAANARSQ